MLWMIERDLSRQEDRVYLKNMYPVPVTEKQYEELKLKDRKKKLKEKYSVVNCLVQIIEDKLPGPEKGATLEDYIYDNDPEDRTEIAVHFKTAVKKLLSLINQIKIKPTRKAQILSALKASLKKTPDQIAEILLAGIYADIETPVKILESSTITGEQLYENFKEWGKHIDTFYPETGGGYAVVQDPSSIFLNENGDYKTVSPIEELIDGESSKFIAIIPARLSAIADNFEVFQFYRMVVDALTEKLSIPLNQGGIIESLAYQAERLETCRSLLFINISRVKSLDKDYEGGLKELLSEYEGKTVEEYYPCQKVVDYCKAQINGMSEYRDEWFYDIKDFYMKEQRIPLMSSDEIEKLKSTGNKEQVRHFMGLVGQSCNG